MKRLLLPLALLGSALVPSHGQTFFVQPHAEYLTPGWRGTAGTEFSSWDVFYSRYNGINYPDMAAPNGTGRLASAAGFTPPAGSLPGNPYAFWHLNNPTITQTGTSTAFIIGPGTEGNIYSFTAPTSYVLADSTPYTLGSVNLQFQTDGSLMDFDSIRLVANGQEYAPTNFVTEYLVSISARGGITNRTGAQWNLTGLGITSYTITFHSATSSNSLQQVLLDTTPTYVEAVQSARTWSAASGDWSTAGNWSGGTVGPVGGNIAVAGGSAVTIDGGTREIGELKLEAPGAFTIGASGDGVLKINTGITAKPAAAAAYVIDAPVQLGSYNISYLNAHATVDFNAPISGDTGMEFNGPGRMRLKADNTFTGSLSVDGGTLEIAGTNTYGGNTIIYKGTLVVKTDAPDGDAGALGMATSAVSLGNAGSVTDPEAVLLIDGAHTVGRNIALGEGDDPKKLGGQNTGTGATFSGTVTLNSTATTVRLFAEDADDVVTFSGALTGGSTSGTLTKTGAGTVIFSGGTKDYLNGTVVSEGTLVFEQSIKLRSLSIGAGATVVLGESGSAFADFSSPGAVPEPSSAVLLLSGASLLLRLRRRSGAGDSPIHPDSELLL
jgi:autotransporter-associated beta strand protein